VRPIEWLDDRVRFIDQTQLPENEEFVETDDPSVIAGAIRELSIRGAPLIGIAAAYGVALAAVRTTKTGSPLQSHLLGTITHLASTRPTAVNLFWALGRMRRIIDSLSIESPGRLRKALVEEALAIHKEDEEMGERIGGFGADLFPNAATVLTHCNTGMLATGGKGTALAAIITAWERKTLKHVYIDETRPLFQGARLTAWELKKVGVPHTLVSDSTAGFLMQQGKVSTVIVGADRIAANGDVANKVGTYGLAVLARYHQIPFYVAAPSSSIDFELRDGKAIPLEQRDPDELVICGGKRIAPEGTEVYSPAFDVTPNSLVTAIVTEQGVAAPPYQVSLCAVRQTHREGVNL